MSQITLYDYAASCFGFENEQAAEYYDDYLNGAATIDDDKKLQCISNWRTGVALCEKEDQLVVVEDVLGMRNMVIFADQSYVSLPEYLEWLEENEITPLVDIKAIYENEVVNHNREQITQVEHYEVG